MIQKIVYLVLFVYLFSNCSVKTKEKVEYIELTPKEFKERIEKAAIAYLPLGTLEWHGEHLPLGSDGIQSFEFFKQLAQEAGGIVLPMIFLGPDTMTVYNDKEYYGMDIFSVDEYKKPNKYPQMLRGSAYHTDTLTFKLILESILKQLSRQGFKIVVAHGHGPSTGFFIAHSKEWEKKYNLKLFQCWCRENKECAEMDNRGEGIQVDHAASNETSLMMYFRPELVEMSNLPKDTNIWPLGVWGKDPRKYASAENGKKIVEYHKVRMVNLLKKELVRIKKGGKINF
jgi:creatinine amidohydrolase